MLVLKDFSFPLGKEIKSQLCGRAVSLGGCVWAVMGLLGALLERVRLHTEHVFFLCPDGQGREVSKSIFPKKSKGLCPQFIEDIL